MTVSLEQKVDFLLKKLGYSATKTGIAEDESLSGTVKAPFAEAIASPLVVPGTSVWSQSTEIPATPPASSQGVVEVYGTTNAFQMTMDNTVSGKRTYLCRSGAGNNTSPMVGNWIDTQFGADYIVNVYKGDPASGGVKLSASGTGSNDTWFFDYSAGVLNFNGSVVPTGVTENNIYITASRYVGETGVTTNEVNTRFNNLDDDVSLIFEKLISVDDRLESVSGYGNLLLQLESNTPTSATQSATPKFIDDIPDGGTTTFVVTLDQERGVYALNDIPQPTVQIPRGDTVVFDVSALAQPTHFRIYQNGTELSHGVDYSTDSVTIDTTQVDVNLTKVFYRNSQTPGLGWIIEITDN